ncbi:RNA 2',3'-cyclic phosphodiesterase [Defluviitalea phaphyphila]|uniref:RNA 2',3'-cyclic phosphodiesterase n=1 Tax=Defluviitalea phaphyphila TaxID=1473580 RepID=UPI00072FD357|nr:RNA 2',3'-cyclic phosphodiesterase [Defluviitalea phaphyphila]
MRVFIAINFEDSLKSYLKEKQNKLKLYCTKGNFVDKENFHLTLKFIGEIDKKKIAYIKKAMDITGENCEKFLITLGELGAFKRNKEYIPWIGLDGDLYKLNYLYDKIQLELYNVGFHKENRPLKPHITLGRRVILQKNLSYIIEKICIDKINILVKSITLMESTRINGKLKYIPIYEKELSSKE